MQVSSVWAYVLELPLWSLQPLFAEFSLLLVFVFSVLELGDIAVNLLWQIQCL
jgi:hypothetical protein